MARSKVKGPNGLKIKATKKRDKTARASVHIDPVSNSRTRSTITRINDGDGTVYITNPHSGGVFTHSSKKAARPNVFRHKSSSKERSHNENKKRVRKQYPKGK